MQKYQDCILDLEKGLQSPELATSIYASLIVAYEKLGNPSLAAEYSERLKVINQAKQKTELAVPQ
jgi:hypothetical protein